MKKILYILVITILLSGCFSSPDITPPMFIPKSPPDSLIETGIDAHPDNAIYLEWEEPSSAEEEGILSYYIYRGTKSGGEYKFKYLDEVIRNSGIIYESNSYIDYDVSFDSTYYYYLRSHNDFTDSKTNSDTAIYKLTYKPSRLSPSGDIYENKTSFSFIYPTHIITGIDVFYLRLYYFQSDSYKIKYFTKTYRFDLSRNGYYVYIQNNNYHTTVLLDSLWENDGIKYLEKGNYRWRVDAVASELGGAPETEGSESDWTYFTVK
jgi:hypothetical protein